MSIKAAARRDAYNDFSPGKKQPETYRYWDDAYYCGCYDLAWKDLQDAADKRAEEERLRELAPPTLEERVEALEEQVQQLRELLQP